MSRAARLTISFAALATAFARDGRDGFRIERLAPSFF